MTDYTSATTDNAATNARQRNLISADKVQGTAVYNHADDRLGTVNSIYIDKRSGEVAYVAMSFGGFLGIGEKYHPLPWDLLDYDTEIGGYRVDLDHHDLIDAPAYDLPALAAYDFDTDAGRIDDYYTERFRTVNAGRSSADTPERPSGFYSAASQASRNTGVDGAPPAKAANANSDVSAYADGLAAVGPEGGQTVRDYEKSTAGIDLPRRDETTERDR